MAHGQTAERQHGGGSVAAVSDGSAQPTATPSIVCAVRVLVPLPQPCSPLSALPCSSSARCLTMHATGGLGRAGEIRVEKDTFGDIKVPANKYWGAQTQR